MRVIVPATGNEAISNAANCRAIPLPLVASIRSLLVTTMLSIGQFSMARHLGRCATRKARPAPLQRLGAFARTLRAKWTPSA